MENSNFSQRPKFELGFIQNSVELLTRGIQKNFATCRNSPKLAGTDRNWEERGQTPVSGSGSGGYLPLVSRSMRGSTERLKPGLRLGCSSESLKLLMHPQSTKITRDPPIHAPVATAQRIARQEQNAFVARTPDIVTTSPWHAHRSFYVGSR